MSRRFLIIGGKGVVGSAMFHILHKVRSADVLDIADPPSLALYKRLKVYETVFICVPTPPAANAVGYDYSAVQDVLERLRGYKGHICLRSTVTPLYLSGLAPEVRKRLVYHPEFLSARTAKRDIAKQTVRVYGSDDKSSCHTVDSAYPEVTGRLIITSLEEASLLKLAHNAWGAMNVAFANEIQRLVSHCGGQYEQGFRQDFETLLRSLMRSFATYSQVPGHDGRHGFGGTCFPKDLQALISVADQCSINPHLLRGILALNQEVRGEA